MKKSSKKLARIVIAIVAIFALASVFLGVNELRGAGLSFSSISAQKKINGIIDAIVEKDADTAIKDFGYTGGEERYSDALSALGDIGITILSGKTDWNSIYKINGNIIGDVTIQVKADKTQYWVGNSAEDWFFVAISDNEKIYDVNFSFEISGDKVSFGDIDSVYESETALADIPVNLTHMMMLLRGYEPEKYIGLNDCIISLDMPQFLSDFVDRTINGFDEIVDGNYDSALDCFGFSDNQSKNCFDYGMSFVESSSLTILSASVDNQSVQSSQGVVSAIVRLSVQQDDTTLTFGYNQEYPTGIYAMDFVMEMDMRSNAIVIPEFVNEDSKTIPGLRAIYLPGEQENSLTIFETNDVVMPFLYNSEASFMTELWLVLQSYDLTSNYAIFWGYGA